MVAYHYSWATLQVLFAFDFNVHSD